MNPLKKPLMSVCLLLCLPAWAASSVSLAQGPATDHYESRCRGQALQRDVWPQGTALWGTRRAWAPAQNTDERRGVLVSVDHQPLRKADVGVRSVRLKDGYLEAAPDASISLVGTVLQGTSSDGKPVEVALCGMEPVLGDSKMRWYRLEAWNPVAQEWENPCVATGEVPDPRALAVAGFWDSSGAHHESPGRFTLACENGAIAKCIHWGYKPWARRNGQSLASLHQACTRMARADYCGNGRSHTREGRVIDMYDVLGLLSRTRDVSPAWDPAQASFEAAWSPDGATCLARTRDGRPLASILQECPGRFRASAVDLGGADLCAVQRASGDASQFLLRNRSYGSGQGPVTSVRGR